MGWSEHMFAQWCDVRTLEQTFNDWHSCSLVVRGCLREFAAIVYIAVARWSFTVDWEILDRAWKCFECQLTVWNILFYLRCSNLVFFVMTKLRERKKRTKHETNLCTRYEWRTKTIIHVWCEYMSTRFHAQIRRCVPITNTSGQRSIHYDNVLPCNVCVCVCWLRAHMRAREHPVTIKPDVWPLITL